jgi:hypothetical protein
MTTIRRTIKQHGYRRYVACRRPFISKKSSGKATRFCNKILVVEYSKVEEGYIE